METVQHCGPPEDGPLGVRAGWTLWLSPVSPLRRLDQFWSQVCGQRFQEQPGEEVQEMVSALVEDAVGSCGEERAELEGETIST